jgi:hypothetical protein
VYHPAYYGTPNYCYNCSNSSDTAAAAVAGVVVGATLATAANSNKSSSTTTTTTTTTQPDTAAYNAGYVAGATNVQAAAPTGGYAMGGIYTSLPAGCMSPTVSGTSYKLCGNTWFEPSYGANGVSYQVVPAP